MAENRKSPHRIQHTEISALKPNIIRDFRAGEVFVREGAPCMVLAPQDHSGIVGLRLEQSMIVNLQTGNCWVIDNNEKVWSATDVKLTYKTSRVE